MTEDEYEREYLAQRLAFQPWIGLSLEQEEEQRAIQSVLAKRSGAIFGKKAYVAPNAKIFTDFFALGDRSFVAGGAIIRGIVRIGQDCSVNPYSHLAGRIKIGSGVRIAGGVSIYGFNHGTARTDIMIKDQPITMDGIEIGDGTWIGAGAVVLDKANIGSHCVVAAGAIVTKSFPDYKVLAGNPARIISDRKSPSSNRTGGQDRIRNLLLSPIAG